MIPLSSGDRERRKRIRRNTFIRISLGSFHPMVRLVTGTGGE
jgi:hypothetical protein